MMDSYEKVASENGLTILGKAKADFINPKLYAYFLLPCGHTQDIKHCHVKTGKWRCRTCLQNKYNEQAKLCGLEIVDNTPTNDADYKLYKHLNCGHSALYTSYYVAKNVKKGISCQKCLSELRFSTAEKLGLELLEDVAGKWMYREYKFKNCGHIQHLKLQDVMKGLVASCKTCQLLRLKSEAEKEGLVLLEVKANSDGIKENNYKNLYQLPCGCNKLLKAGNVRNGSWACDFHSHLGKESFLYVIKFITDEDSFLKIGKTVNIEARLKNINFKESVYAEVIYRSPPETGANIIAKELNLHKNLKEYNLDHSYMRHFMENGFTECYHSSHEEVILRKIKEVF